MPTFHVSVFVNKFISLRIYFKSQKNCLRLDNVFQVCLTSDDSNDVYYMHANKQPKNTFKSLGHRYPDTCGNLSFPKSTQLNLSFQGDNVHSAWQ